MATKRRCITGNFYPRSPCGERRTSTRLGPKKSLFLSTLSLRRATTDGAKPRPLAPISIHALLAESDSRKRLSLSNVTGFLSTLSLRRATCYYHKHLLAKQFLSTLSLRRATSGNRFVCSKWNISIHALLAESDEVLYGQNRAKSISIHALLAESDTNSNGESLEEYRFLSTLSLRRATRKNHRHGPHHHHFYPRSPCGERLCAQDAKRRAYEISIHALLAESDRWTGTKTAATAYFYPRSPCGERRSNY